MAASSSSGTGYLTFVTSTGSLAYNIGASMTGAVIVAGNGKFLACSTGTATTSANTQNVIGISSVLLNTFGSSITYSGAASTVTWNGPPTSTNLLATFSVAMDGATGSSSGAAYVTAYINTQGIAAFNNAGYNSIARQTISPQILSGGYYGYANGNTILPLTTGDQFYVAMYTAEAITVGTVGGVPCQLSLYQLP